MKTQSKISVRITRSKYVALSECAEEVKFVNLLLEEIVEVQIIVIVHEDNQGGIFLADKKLLVWVKIILIYANILVGKW